MVVRPGDTLWGIAERVLGDGRRWSEILTANREEVESPHRLRPGTVLRVPTRGRRSDRAGAAAADTLPRPGESLFAEPPDRSIRPRELAVSGGGDLVPVPPGDFASAPFLVRPDSLRGRGRTLSRLDVSGPHRETPGLVGSHDRVLLSLAGWPAEPGELYQAFHWGREVGEYGVVARPVAVLEIESVRGDRAEARMRARFGAYRLGDPVVPLPPVPSLEGTRLRRVEGGASVALLGLGRNRPVLAPGSRVFLASGPGSGLRPGDELVVDPGPAVAANGVGGTAATGSVARLRVLRTAGRTATACVVRLRSPRLGEGATARLVGRRAGAAGAGRGGR